MTVPRILRWLVAEDPAPQDFHRWHLSEHPDATTDGGGKYRCPTCDRFVPLDHTCPPATNAQVLAAAFPWHPQMDVWAAEDRARDDVYARYRRNGGRIVPATLDSTGKAA